MSCVRPWQMLIGATLSLGVGCAFDTAPIAGSAAGADASVVHAGSAGASAQAAPTASSAGSSGATGIGTAATTPANQPATSSSTAAATAAGAGVGAPGVAVAAGAPAPPNTSMPVPPPPAAGPTNAGPVGMPSSDICDAAASYGLRLSADLAWDGVNALSSSGRGPAELYALIEVERVDPQTRAITASGRVCGISLPPNGNSLSCGLYEMRFADKLWDQRDIPKLSVQGSYDCRPDGCSLQLAPTSYVVGIQHDPPQSPWPQSGTTQVSQYPDHDSDGMPGVTANIIGQASPMPNVTCGYTPLTAMSGGPGKGPAESADGRMLLGLRTQLMAAVGLAADCHVTQATGALQSLDLRAAGCMLPGVDWTQGMTNMQPSESPCSEDLRNTIDQSLPQYEVLSAGQAPPAAVGGSDTAISRGTVLRAVRFRAGSMPTCEQVRMATK